MNIINQHYIRNLLGHKIYSRAVDYYNNDMVLNFKLMPDMTIDATVAGSDDNAYDVHIDLDQSSYDCSCPYDDTCKHIGAVLIHYVKEYEEKIFKKLDKLDQWTGMDTIQKFKKQGLKQKEQIIQIEPTLKNHEPIFIFQEKTPLAPTNKQRYKLIFSAFYDSFQHQYRIMPALQYIKQDGTPGRIEKYASQKVTEPIDDEHIMMLNLINTQPERRLGEPGIDLAQTISFLQSSNIPISMITKKGASVMTFYRISRIELSFKLYALQNIEKVFFSPILHAYDDSGTIRAQVDMITDRMFLSGIVNYYLSDDGIVSYCDNPKIVNLISMIYAQRHHITAGDIEDIRDYCGQHLQDLAKVRFSLSRLRMIPSIPKPLLLIDDNHDYLEIHSYFRYGSKEIAVHADPDLITPDTEQNGEELVVLMRNHMFEKKTCDQLAAIFKDAIQAYYLDYSMETRGHFTLDTNMKSFVVKYAERLIDNGCEIRMKKTNAKIDRLSARVTTKITSGIDWFDTQTTLVHDDGSEEPIITDPALLKHGIINTKKGYAILSRDDISYINKLAQAGMKDDGTLPVPKLNFTLIDILHERAAGDARDEISARMSIYEKLKNFSSINDYQRPKSFNAELRHYQNAGYNWLHFLHEYGLHGCLADDMGLGKTIQTLALLLSLKQQGVLGPSLIVVPVTTVQNWISEIDRFAPDLRWTKHIGMNRNKDKAHLTSTDLVITSYQTLRQDIEILDSIEFYYCVLDESQNIKNASSQTFKAVKTIRAKHRLSLTGTPVENNTMELWAQIDFLNPGLLGSRNEFLGKYARPIEKYKSREAAEQLRAITFPFILRRKKEDVALDLPEKEEIVLYSEMTADQQTVYDNYKKQCRGKVDRAIDEAGLEKSAMTIFESLLRLRQMALFPELVDKKYSKISSCKYELLKDMIDEILQEKHKLLIFSQFVQSLAFIRAYLDAQGITYSYIDGSTRKRAIEIKNFQDRDDVRVFLLSIKAGGVGINLTAADYVILFDPWWNPAVENQAIDRAHRIGQTKKVIAYKMIVKGTVEEKILQLQNKKKSLVRDLISEEASFYKSLEREDIMELFS